MTPLPLPNLEEATALLDVVREQVRTAIEQTSEAFPERAILFVPFEDIAELTRVSDRCLMMIVKQLELYHDSFESTSELDTHSIVIHFFYVSRRIEVLLLTQRVIDMPEVQLARDVAALVAEEAREIRYGTFDFSMPACVVDYYQKMNVGQKENFRSLLREHLSLDGFSILGRFHPSVLTIECKE